MSHLFYQGLNSAMLFKTSREFRESLQNTVAENSGLSKHAGLAESLIDEPRKGHFRVVYAVTSSSAGRLNLPLFSKISLRQAARWLDGLGYEVLLTKIPAPPDERLLKRKRGKSRKTF